MKLLALIAGISFFPFAHAQLELACPDRVSLDKASVSGTFDRNTYTPVAGDLPLLLTGASAYDGPPEQGAAIKSEGRRPCTATQWSFAGAFEHGKWLSCDYAHGILRLAVRVPDAATSCGADVASEKKTRLLRIKLTCR